MRLAPCSRSAHDRTTPGGTRRHQTTRNDTWNPGQLIQAAWTALWCREAGPSSLGRWQLVEHEAFVSLLAERNGVSVPKVRAAGTAAVGDALLVLEVSGRRLDEPSPEDVTDATLSSAWEALQRLHDVGISRGGLDAAHLLVQGDGIVAIADLAGAMVPAPAAELALDRAQPLVTTSLLCGPERAVAAARTALGERGLGDLLPYLQLAALTPSTKQAVKREPDTLDRLRARAADAAGSEIPELVQLHRFT